MGNIKASAVLQVLFLYYKVHFQDDVEDGPHPDGEEGIAFPNVEQDDCDAGDDFAGDV